MENDGTIYISPNFSKYDFLNLKLELSSSDKDWQKALEIFDDRFYGRFWGSIQNLSTNVNVNGFAIMALDCLLIETLLQFDLGVDTTPPANWRSFSTFLKRNFPEHFDSVKASRFYSDIRCGILHSAQTKNNARLTTKNEFVVDLKDDILLVSVERLTAILFQYYNEYKNKVLDRNNVTIRRLFINKMNFICIR